MKKFLIWICASNRWKHVVGGMLIGMASDGVYCAALAGICTAGALEFKDYQWEGKPDWIDFMLTLAGVFVGYYIKVGFLNCVL